DSGCVHARRGRARSRVDADRQGPRGADPERAGARAREARRPGRQPARGAGDSERRAGEARAIVKRWVLVVVWVLAVVRARAAVVVPADLGELSRDARAIVRGGVAAVEGRWTDDRRTIETLVTLEVESTLKGSSGATIQFRVPGGDLGRYRSV